MEQTKLIAVEEKDSWDIEYRDEQGGGFICSISKKHPDAKTIAHRICKCVNGWDDIIALCRKLGNELGATGIDPHIREVLAKADAVLAKAEKE